MSRPLKIGDVEVQTGEKKFGWLKIAERPSRLYPYPAVLHPHVNTTVDMPIWVVNGSEDGPTLCVTAGEHGMEYSGIAAVIRVCKELTPQEIKGTLLAVPILNLPEFRARVPYVNPMDNKDFGYTSANPNGTITEVMRHVYEEDILKKADYWIDIHSGDLNEEQLPSGYAYFHGIGEKRFDAAVEGMARAYGLEIVYDSTDVSRDRNTLKNLFEVKGLKMPHIKINRGGLATMKEVDVSAHVTGIRNVMKYLNMLDGAPQITVKQRIARRRWEVKASKDGVFYRKVEPGEEVHKGQVLGRIENLQGDLLEELVAPEDGLIRLMFNYVGVYSGERLILAYAPTEPAPPDLPKLIH